MPVPFASDYVLEKLRRTGMDFEKRAIRELSGVDLPAAEATRLLARIQVHKWYISERLGRDVGLRVAAIDYLEHVEPLRPERIEARSAVWLIWSLWQTCVVENVLWIERVLRSFTRALRGARGVSLLGL